MRISSLHKALWMLILASCLHVSANEYLFESQEQIQQMKEAIAKQDSLFGQTFIAQKKSVDAQIALPITVPMPKDAGGGYTHEKHKKNGQLIRSAGRMYMLTGEQQYLDYTKTLLNGYANIYADLPLHPEKKEQSPGRLFWQSLNEAVWLVYAIQGYDAIKSALTEQERGYIENDLFREIAKYLSVDSPQTFNKVHNHGTWATAAVGMTGFVLGELDWVEQALYGLDKSGKGGFMRQLEQLFSPDGYYNEGPYYQRYALMPFVLFAKAIDVNQPERKIFEFREKIVLKAIHTTIGLSYNGLFFPINDALKDKGTDTTELVIGVTIAYGKTQDKGLLSVAKQQAQILLTGDGLLVANAMDAGLTQAYPVVSKVYSDGVDGNDGALIVMREPHQDTHAALVFKATSQGLGHGHFDKLNWLFYDNQQEVVTDYGAARFLNVEAKYGGHYLPENKSFAKLTIAHNTLVVDEENHFKGKTKVGNKHHPEVVFFEQEDGLQVSKARMENAYDGVIFSRTQALINIPDIADKPFVIDLLDVQSRQSHQYDLPLYYKGHIVETNFALDTATQQLNQLGDKNGYQHLWKRAQGNSDDSISQVTWILGRDFYTFSTMNSANQTMLFAQVGANDPHFNLRHENALIVRKPKAKNHKFVSILEPHGEYNPSKEFTVNSHSQITNIQLEQQNNVSIVRVDFVDKPSLLLALQDNQKTRQSFTYKGQEFVLKGHGQTFLLNDIK